MAEGRLDRAFRFPLDAHAGTGARSRTGRLSWVHTHGSTRRLYRLVESGRASIQKITISRGGGRWWVSVAVRITQPVAKPAARLAGEVVGVDAGLKHLAALSRPVEGLTDADGHVANPRVLAGELRRLRRVDRALARSVRGSKNHARLKHRRARLLGAVAQTRSLHLHRLTRELAARFETVVVEDLAVAAMANRKRRLGRSLADAALGELRRQLAYKAPEHGHGLVVVDRWFPSSKTCSSCASVKAKLERRERIYTCDTCGVVLDRDTNAALTLEREGRRILQQGMQLAGLRPESGNGDPRPEKTAAHRQMGAVAALVA